MRFFPSRDDKIAGLRSEIAQIRKDKRATQAEKNQVEAKLQAKISEMRGVIEELEDKVGELKGRVGELEQIESNLSIESEQNLNAFQLSEQNVELQAHIIAGYIAVRKSETLAVNATQGVLENGVKNAPDQSGIDTAERW